jgi:glycosyltransferase involved in cell wall biosynthesis
LAKRQRKFATLPLEPNVGSLGVGPPGSSQKLRILRFHVLASVSSVLASDVSSARPRVPSRLRILHTESSNGWGGQELRILAEAEGLVRRGHQVCVAAPIGHRIHIEARSRGVPVVDFPLARKSLAGVLALRRWLRSADVDVVNTHSSTDSWLAAVAVTSLPKLARPALVRTRHVSVPIAPSFANRWLYGSAARRVVTTCEAIRHHIVRDLALPPERVVSVPTGVRPEEFEPGDRRAARRALGLPENALLVGIVATLRSWKGHPYLLHAFAQLPTRNALLVIIGDGPQRARLEKRTREHGLEWGVRFVGEQAQVVPWLRALDIFVLPSYAYEGVPQALVQAMMTGLPCITTPVGGIPEVAQADRTALVVPPRNSAALARAIMRLAGDGRLRAALGASAREHCLEHMHYDRMVLRMEAVFRDAANPTRPRTTRGNDDLCRDRERSVDEATTSA